jgi:hypothetical protein
MAEGSQDVEEESVELQWILISEQEGKGKTGENAVFTHCTWRAEVWWVCVLSEPPSQWLS